MLIPGRALAVLVSLPLIVAGCSMMGRGAAKSAPSAQTRGPVFFEQTSHGLPLGKIWKSQIAFGDINGDGFDDIAAVSRLSDGAWVWTSDGKGNWTPAANGLPRETFCGGGVAFADFNKDGKLDLAIADHCKGVYVFFGDGAGNWTMASSGLPTVGSEDIAAGDVNGDGCPDVAVVTAQEEGIRVFTGDCKGKWQESSDGLPLQEWGNGIVMADMNGDGKLDIVAAYSAGPRVYLGNGDGTWHEASAGLPAPDIHGLYWGIAVGDINNDGRLDIASGAALPGVEVFLQQPDGSYVNSSEGITPMNALGVTLADLDKDGNLDLIAAGKTALDEIGGVYGVLLFKGDGHGHWTAMHNTGIPETGKERVWGVATGDVNHDGIVDIGAAFGDVIAPTWHSGKPGEKPGEKPSKEKEGPERGRFGSIEVWTGQPPVH